jgi:hypothetical protein
MNINSLVAILSSCCCPIRILSPMQKNMGHAISQSPRFLEKTQATSSTVGWRSNCQIYFCAASVTLSSYRVRKLTRERIPGPPNVNGSNLRNPIILGVRSVNAAFYNGLYTLGFT